MDDHASPIDFWFDFISPFGYLASLRIDAIAAQHGRTVRWHPTLLGVTVLKVMGLKPVLETPLKGPYVIREMDRYQRRHGVTLGRAMRAPRMNPLPSGRAFAWLLHHAPEHARAFARTGLRDYWALARDLDRPAALIDCGARAGVPADVMEQAVGDPAAAALLRAEVEAGIERGVFGSPFFIVDGEPFFGVDKLELIDEWLRRGGW